ncbi:MAG: sigma-54 interaction domain-containing protein [Candidatus Rokuibacteriota bacterium]
MSGSDSLRKLTGRSAAIQQVRDQIQRIARSPVPVLILGETGTGKELCAEAIALASGRTPFVPVNCAALPEGLVESELFGHERGAFTGAVRSHAGMIALAHGGILFLDELAELPSPVQAKLLRTLESGEYRRVGSTKTLQSDFRILAATSGDLERVIASGRLRADLLHRLGAVRVCLPALRQRLEDIPLYAEEFLRRYLERCDAGPSRISPEACALLMQHDWPGNLRQLRNVVEASAAVAGSDDVIEMLHVVQFLIPSAKDAAASEAVPSLAEVRARAEMRAILEALRRAGGNRERAAKLLRISEATLYRKLGQRSGPQLA